MLFANPFAKEVHKLHVYQTTLHSISTICYCCPLMPFLSCNSNEENKRQGIRGRKEKKLTILATIMITSNYLSSCLGHVT